MISELSPLCHISCDNDQVYTVYGCIRASLVEVNERLVTNPQLLVTNVSLSMNNNYCSIVLLYF